MKTSYKTLSLFTTLFLSNSALYAQDDMHHNLGANQTPQVFQVEKRLDNYTRPTMFTPTKATAINGAITENVVTSTQRILNAEAHFLKKGVVKTVGKSSSPWEATSDEGGSAHAQTAPNPLTFYAVGSASSLLTQVERAIQILNLNIEDVKVETKIYFRWNDPFTNKWAGFTDKVVSNIIIKSDESPQKIKELKELAIQGWAVGEALANETKIDADIVINADDWAGLNARPGKVASPISIDKGFTLTNVTPDLKLQTIEVEDDLAVDMGSFPSPFNFTEVGIAESAHDATRPYMHKTRAKSLTQNYETWELYSDDSHGYAGEEKAPSSWEYFTIGTSFCLMSQLTPNQMFFKKQGVNIEDFRVEHQFNYQQENFMTPSMKGELSEVITRIAVKSNAPQEDVKRYAMQSLRTCFAGEGIQNETEMQTNIFLNGKLIK